MPHSQEGSEPIAWQQQLCPGLRCSGSFKGNPMMVGKRGEELTPKNVSPEPGGSMEMERSQGMKKAEDEADGMKR